MRPRQKRRFYTAGESAEIWDRWRRGQGLWTIARAFGKTSSSRPTTRGSPAPSGPSAAKPS